MSTDGASFPAAEPSPPMDLVEEAVRVLRITTEITRVMEPGEIPVRAVEALHALLHFPVVSVALLEESSGDLRFVADHGLPVEIRAMGFRPGGTARTVLASGQALFVEDAALDPRVDPKAKEFRRAYACLPIRHRENSFGVLFVNFANPHVFTPTEREILTIFSHQIGIALENAHLNRHLKDALDQVKTLSGLIPICSYCKQVRTDTGYWQQVDTFLHERTEAVFSHGICPSCATEVRKEVESMKAVITIIK